jgi:hypothetical protein
MSRTTERLAVAVQSRPGESRGRVVVVPPRPKVPPVSSHKVSGANSESLSAPTSLDKRFWARVEITSEAGCWLWTGARYPAGYGSFTPAHRVNIGAHRYAYATTYGPIPPGLQIMHYCETRHCVRPEHLWAGSPSERMKAAIARGHKPDPWKHRRRGG